MYLSQAKTSIFYVIASLKSESDSLAPPYFHSRLAASGAKVNPKLASSWLYNLK